MLPRNERREEWLAACFLSANASVALFSLVLHRVSPEDNFLSVTTKALLLAPLAAWLLFDHLRPKRIGRSMRLMLLFVQVPYFFIFMTLLGLDTIFDILQEWHGTATFLIAATIWLSFVVCRILSGLFQALFHVRLEPTLAVLPFMLELGLLIERYVYA